MKSLILPILLVLMGNVPSSDSGRILAIFPFNAESHFPMFQQLMYLLARRGHAIDVVSHFPRKKPVPSYVDVVSLNGTLPDFKNNLTMDFVHEMVDGASVKSIAHLAGNDMCKFLERKSVKKLIKKIRKGERYHMVITELLAAHCYLAFGHLLKVPVVGMVAGEMLPWMNDMIGNPDNTAYVPNTLLSFSGHMTFWERLQNTFATISDKLQFAYYTSSQNKHVRKYFGDDAPGVRDLERNISLIFTNSHFSLNGIRPFTPAVVEVGGIHVEEQGPKIAPNLHKWLNESEHGAIYFSFGAMVKIESLPNQKLAAIYSSLAKIAPVRVLMKIAEKEELPPGLPENVQTLSWVSQSEVLKHENIRAFVTHGGYMGTLEAVVHGVPMIGIPLYGDQFRNIDTLVKKHVAVKLDYNEITEAKLDAALDTILYDPSYSIAAKKLSARYLDRPLTAIETGAFWIEYVLKHGPNALRSPVLDLTWWQAALIDVYGALLLTLLLIGLLLKIFIRKLLAVVAAKETKEVSKELSKEVSKDKKRR